MESFYWYKGFGIRYNEWGGTTTVEDLGYILREYPGLGCIDGEKKAKEYIDTISD